ncbi:hypothetical protein HDU97_007214 [Phlyctochytrium planicorne]|nr:hypothetical protein HDU97_007214 [Phlyctochytrium planicorne]
MSFPRSSVPPEELGPWEVFDISEAKEVADFVMTTLFLNTITTVQDSYEHDIVVSLETPPVLSPLANAITLEAYEQEQARVEELERLEEEEKKRREEELAAAANPFEALSSEEIQSITGDIVGAMIKTLASDLDKVIEDQRSKITAQIAKLSIIT